MWRSLIGRMVTKLEIPTDSEPAAQATPARTAGRLPIDIFPSIDAVAADWDALFAAAPASAYQSRAFCAAWMATLGESRGALPCPVLVHGADGAALALLPLATIRLGPLRTLGFMGGRECNFNLPLLRPGYMPDEARARAMLVEAGRRAGAHLVVLRNMPRQLDAAVNPFVLQGALPSASSAYGAALPADAAALEQRLSKDARKKLRRKRALLGEIGEVAAERAQTPQRAQEIVRALTEQKRARMREQGIASEFDDAAMDAFLLRLAGEGALEAHALTVCGRIVAAYAGLTHRGRFSALVNSFDAEERIARCSPGDLLLQAMLADLVGRGVGRFDLGVGEARYKTAVCDETIALFDVVLPVSIIGRLAAPGLRALLRAKRYAKQTPQIAAALARLRRALSGKGRG